jgi:hypothetical protein
MRGEAVKRLTQGQYFELNDMRMIRQRLFFRARRLYVPPDTAFGHR